METVGLARHWITSDINATKTQRLLANVQLRESSEGIAHDNVAFCSALEGSASSEIKNRVAKRFGFLAHGVETRMREVEELLFLLKIMSVGHLAPGNLADKAAQSRPHE